MTRKKKRRMVELVKDLLIVLLAASAIYLALRTGSYADLAGSRPTGWLGAVLDIFDQGSGTVSGVGSQTGEQPVEVRPLRMAVNQAGVGRYGVQYDGGAADKLFSEVFTLLGEALGSAEPPVEVPEGTWRSALSDQTGFYFDFQGKIPLGALYAWLEAGPGDALAGEDARRLLLAVGEDGAAALYYHNEDTGLYYACQAGKSLGEHLQSAAGAYSPNGAAFVYEQTGTEGYRTLAPYVMLPASPVLAREIYRASNPLAGSGRDQARGEVAEALGFHLQSSYTAGDKLVVKEGGDTLELYDRGTVLYHAAESGEPRYPVGSGAPQPSRRELLEATQRVAEQGLNRWCGEARLYLRSITELEEGRWQVEYGYQLSGAAVQLGSEGCAARFIVEGGRISDFYLFLRSYAVVGEQASVLPELQAAAAMSALGVDRGELALVYEDSGAAETVYPGWIAE